jgi:O-antigen ligase
MSFNSPEPSQQSTRQSCIAFSVFLLLVILGVSFPSVPSQGLYGILWTGVGLIMFLFPPLVRIPKIWTGLAVGFVLLSLVGYLPRDWFSVSPWRLEAEKLEMPTGSTAFVQPQVAIQYTVQFAITAAIGLYLLGHRIHSRCQQWIALGFSIAMVVWIVMALILRKEGEYFGLFPNRNHTATLLSMAAFVSVGGLAQAIRHRQIAFVLAFAPCILLSLWILFTVSISRSGILLIGLGMILWFIFLGRKSLRGNTGKALILLSIAIVGAFFLVESTAKNRLSETKEKWVATENMGNVATEDAGFSNDTRWLIFQDTWNMICNESWTGIGAGQFTYVFPQYRNHSNIAHTEIYIHPESDWLFMAAEVGIPATCFILAAVACVVFYAFRNIKKGKGRLLRVGYLVAAILLLAHGVMDVPSHRIGIAMAGILFLACSIQGITQNEASAWRQISRLGKNTWRTCGCIIAAAGVILVSCQASGKFIFPIARSENIAKKIVDLRLKDDVDEKLATSRGEEYNPLPSECPIEAAILESGKLLEIVPLDQYAIFYRAKLALLLGSKDELGRKDFARQQLLDPNYVALCINQSYFWGPGYEKEIFDLWKLALKRATEQDLHKGDSEKNTTIAYRTIIYAAHTMPFIDQIFPRVWDLAEEKQALRLTWVRFVATDLLNQELPKSLLLVKSDNDRKELFHEWRLRSGTKVTAEFATKHPELGLASP